MREVRRRVDHLVATDTSEYNKKLSLLALVRVERGLYITLDRRGAGAVIPTHLVRFFLSPMTVVFKSCVLSW